MAFRRQIVILIAAAIALLGVVYFFIRQWQIERERRYVLTRWLAHDCTVGERGRLEADLRRFGLALEQPFIDAFQQDPPAAELKTALDAAGQEFDEAQNELRTNNAYVVAGVDAAGFESISKPDFFKRRQDEYVHDYHAAALGGLAVIGGAKGQALLSGLAADPASPYQHVAQVVMRK